MVDAIFDKKDQFDRVQELLVPGEQLLMVFDCKGRGSGFLGVTDRRLVVRDDGMTKKSIQSIPFRSLHSVGVSSDSNFLKASTSSLFFSAGPDSWELEFKGDGKAARIYAELMPRVLG